MADTAQPPVLRRITEPSAEALTIALGGKFVNGAGKALCPCHDDHRPSLEITERNGRTVFVCRAGCEQAAVLAALKSRGLWPNGQAAREEATPRRSKQVGAPLQYVAEDGTALRKWRWEPGFDGGRKSYSWQHLARDGSWQKGQGGHKPLLYGHEDIDSADAGEPILVVESEWSRDLLSRAGWFCVATGGSTDWRPEFAAQFNGHRVVLLPDNDEPGSKWAAAIRRDLPGAVLVNLPGLPDKQGPDHWPQIGDKAALAKFVQGALADLLRLEAAIPPPVPSGSWELDPAPEPAPVTTPRPARPLPPTIQSAGDFIGGYTAPDFLVDGIIQRGYLYSGTGRTGDGKTSVALNLAVSVASGQPFAGLEVERGRVVFLAGENPDDVRARLVMECERRRLQPSDLDLHFIEGAFDLVTRFDPLRQNVEALGGCDLVICDTAAAFFAGDDENSNTQLGGYARDLRRLCSELPGNPAVFVPCHPVKGARSKAELLPRGGGAFLAEVDGNLTVWSEDKATVELHHTGKLRGPGFEPLFFRMERRTSEAVRDRKGRLIGSVVAMPMNDEQIVQVQRTQRTEQDHLLEIMLNHPNGSLADWCRYLGWLTDAGEPAKSKIHRRLGDLVDASPALAKKDRAGRYTLTRAGEAEAKRVMGVR